MSHKSKHKSGLLNILFPLIVGTGVANGQADSNASFGGGLMVVSQEDGSEFVFKRGENPEKIFYAPNDSTGWVNLNSDLASEEAKNIYREHVLGIVPVKADTIRSEQEIIAKDTTAADTSIKAPENAYFVNTDTDSSEYKYMPGAMGSLIWMRRRPGETEFKLSEMSLEHPDYMYNNWVEGGEQIYSDSLDVPQDSVAVSDSLETAVQDSVVAERKPVSFILGAYGNSQLQQLQAGVQYGPLAFVLNAGFGADENLVDETLGPSANGVSGIQKRDYLDLSSIGASFELHPEKLPIYFGAGVDFWRYTDKVMQNIYKDGGLIKGHSQGANADEFSGKGYVGVPVKGFDLQAGYDSKKGAFVGARMHFNLRK
ncbi:MAG: hypothetical protein KJI69_06290 [Patescibacteria group bacterium]|nr:hypothetical protein [Patescibacteria group bacterium]